MSDRTPDTWKGACCKASVSFEQADGYESVEQLQAHIEPLRLAVHHFSDGGDVEKPSHMLFPAAQIRTIFHWMTVLCPTEVVPDKPTLDELQTLSGCEKALNVAARWCNEMQKVQPKRTGKEATPEMGDKEAEAKLLAAIDATAIADSPYWRKSVENRSCTRAKKRARNWFFAALHQEQSLGTCGSPAKIRDFWNALNEEVRAEISPLTPQKLKTTGKAADLVAVSIKNLLHGRKRPKKV